MKLVLDTNAYVDFASGDAAVVGEISRSDSRLYIPFPVLGELAYGFAKGSHSALNHRKLRDFIEALHVQTIESTPAVVSLYGRIYLDLVQRGRKIPINDVWIAACCMSVDGVLLTRNAHFDAVEGLSVVMR